ncbi:MAG: hypothetical protein B0W54_15055 [Cellvibrio sp. 79]|nr:MAG: hypothetical protein B0W54_15055 [Cellvibrio sp. 79]
MNVGWIIAAVAPLATASVFAQDLPFGECRLGYWSSSRNLDHTQDIAQGLCFSNWKPSVSDSVSFGFSVQGHIANEYDTTGDKARLREGYADIGNDHWSLRLGRQIIAWGRADRINPTDYFSPRDFTLLVPEDDEQRRGIDAALAQYHLNDSNRLSLVIARFEPHKMPQGLLPAGIVRSAEPDDAEVAVKYDHIGNLFDWSVSYYDGYDRFSRYRLAQYVNDLPRIYADYESLSTWGFDTAAAAGSWTLRTELTHSTQERTQTGDEISITRAIVGVDHDFLDTANINVQWFSNHREHTSRIPIAIYQEGLDRLNSEFGFHDQGVTLRLSNRFLNEQLKIELAAILDTQNQSYVIRPRLTYALNDQIKITAGADAFSGIEQSYFGVRENNDLRFIEFTIVY